MAFNEQEEAKVRELLAAFENGKRIADLEPAQGLPGGMRIEVMDADGETRSMELDQAVAEAGNPIAGRWWDNNLATPTAGGWFGSLEALRNLPQTLGLGRYLVTDDRKMRKLDPKDSRRFVDGSPAALDGSMGQCMWCWNRAWYFTEIVTAERTYWAITLKPLEGQKSYRIPVGGTSWLGVGVLDRPGGWKLCSVISDEKRYCGGHGHALTDYDLSRADKHPALDTPQITMLGMPHILSITSASEYARNRGEGWEANWFVANAAVKILFAVIMGTRDSQAEYNPEKDADGLYQGGFGIGACCELPDYSSNYNNGFPIIPTSVGVELGDSNGLVDYDLPPSVSAEDQNTPYYTIKVPCFLGLVHAGYGHMQAFITGMVINITEDKKMFQVYVSESMTTGIDYEHLSVDGLQKVTEGLCQQGYIKRLSTRGLCMVPTEVGGSASTYYADRFGGTTSSSGCYVLENSSYIGCLMYGGVFNMNFWSMPWRAYYEQGAPLCFFAEDPTIELD